MSDPSGDGGRWRQRRGGVWGGGLLIVLGVYFLLNNLGLLPPITWEIIWPIVLILVGVWIVLQRRQ